MRNKQLLKAIKNTRLNRIWKRVISAMGCMVIFCTVYALILPALTMERTGCSLDEHTHTESCYEQEASLSCTYEVHAHTPECCGTDGTLLCGMADYVVHEHNDACVDENGAVVCALPVMAEHEHTEDCYAPAAAHTHTNACYIVERGELVCELAETEGHTHVETCFVQGQLLCALAEEQGHTHGEGCAETVLTCQVTEETHTHTEECYQINSLCDLEETQGHTHDTACYESLLVCEIAEEVSHAHGDACFAQISVLNCGLEEIQTPAEPELICQRDVVKLHTHSDSCYETVLDENGAEQKRLICGQLEVKQHIHEESCFAVEAEKILVCGLEEHIHTEACAGNAATETTEAVETKETTAAAEETAATEEGFGFFALRPTTVVDGGTFTSQEGNELTWELTYNPMNDEYTLTFEGEGAMPDYTHSNQTPWGFVYANYRMHLVFGNGITHIGNYAFYRMGILSIEWGGVTSIGASAFHLLGANVRGGGVGSGEMMSHTKLSDNIRVVGNAAFSNSVVRSVELNEGLETIGASAFQLTADSTVHIPSTVRNMTGSSFIGVKAYTVSPENPNFCTVDGVLYSKDMTVLVDLPQYMQISEFTIPNTVREISKGALASLSSVRKVTVSSSVEVYPKELFTGCSVLEEVWFEDGTAPYNFDRMFFQGHNISNVRLPENTSFAIDSAIFSGYSDGYASLETFRIPNGVTSIGRLWTYDNGVMKALEEVIYDAAKAKFTGWQSFGPDAHFDLTIGAHVNYLYKQFSDCLLPNVLSFRFEGPNRFFVEKGAFNNAPAPFTGLSGLFYVDEQGLVYHCDEETGEAALIYCQPGITDVLIPAIIDPDVETYPEEPGIGREFTVTTVRENALKYAADLRSVVFEDLSVVTTLETLSLANCQSLSSINGQTAVEMANALFAHAQVGNNMFYNTGLVGAPGSGTFDQKMDGDDRLELEAADASKLEITASGDLTWVANQNGQGGYQTLTGQSVTITAAVGNTEEEQTNRYRVYFRTTGEDAELSIVPGDTEFINYWEFEHHGTEDPCTFYIEFGTPPEGSTSGIPVICNYPNITSCGGGLTVWGVVITPNEPDGTIIPSEDVMQVNWTTRKDDFAVSVAPDATGIIGVVSDGSGGAKPEQNLNWRINLTRSAETTSPYGKDHATGVEFRNVITLPDGITWREDVAQAIANGEVRASGKYLYAGDTLIASVSESTSWKSIALFIRGRSLTLENGEYVLRWSVSNSNTSAEMNAVSVNVTIYADALRLDVSEDSQYDTAAGATFTGEVYATVHYSYGEDEAYRVDTETGETVNSQLYAAATRKIAGGEGKLLMTHTASAKKAFFGEDVTYTICLSNPGALPWRGEVVRENGGYQLKETLSKLMYISPKNMERMLEENPDLTITIQSALLGQWQRVTGAYEGTESWLNPANSDSMTSTKVNQLTVSVSPDGYCVSVTDGETYTSSSIAEILERIGYAVSDTVVYSCYWPLSETGEKFVLPGGASWNYNVYATAKDSFQAINRDWEMQYNSGGQVDVVSVARVVAPNSNVDAQKNAAFYSTRDMSIGITDVSRNGESLPGSYAANHGDVLDYTLTLSHYGQGTIENLPMVNDVYGSQYLLVPRDLNPELSGLDAHGDFYVLTPGTYENVYVGVDDEGRNLLAASIDVEPADDEMFEFGGNNYTYSGLHTRIRWHFPQIDAGTYQMTVEYQTLVDLDLTGVNYTIGNMVALNDRVDHRLYDTIWGGGSLLSFDKQIVTQPGSTPSRDVLDEDDYSLVGPGEAVTYRLELRSTLDTSVQLNGTKIADALPISAGEFQWQKDVNVVDLRIVADDGVTYEGLDDWYVGDEYGGLLDTRQYLLWPETANIRFSKPGSIYLYITLVYPENTEEGNLWDSFADLIPAGSFTNDFYVYRGFATVRHDLKETGSVLLQKGVFGTYLYQHEYNMSPSISRLNYNNKDLRKRAVAYYVLIYNESSKRLYLNELYDQLPEGFSFLKFIDANGSVNSTEVSRRVTVKGGTSVLTQMNDPGVSYKSAAITADTTDGLKFTISAGTGANALRYDTQMEQYYLESGEALEFGYLCDVGTADQTENVATNMIAMPYTDYLGTGVSIVPREEIRVTAAGQEQYFSDVNDGRRNVKNALQMLAEYGIAGNCDWLVSDVNIYRGSIIPGVTKYVDSYQASMESQAIPYENLVYHNSIVNWGAQLHNSGTLAMTDYTFEDVVQWPYSFVGDVVYTQYGSSVFQEETVSLINIPQHDPHNDDAVTVYDYIGRINRKVTVNGDPVKFGNSSYGFYVSILVDENGNEILSIRFQTASFAIMEGGYMDLTLSSSNFTGNYTYSVYTNQAILRPSQEFTTVGQGTVMKDGEGNKVGAKNAAAVTVSNGFSTTSSKVVSEVGQTATADMMVPSDMENVFEYMLSVTNDTKHEMTKLVILDNLPNVGDHNPFDANASRNSEFMISLIEEQTVSVQILPADAEPYTPANYRVQYSTGSDFGQPQSKHWTGETPDPDDPTTWTDDPADARSLRIIITDPIPSEATVVVKFLTEAIGDVVPGATAYNNFGYHYELQDQPINLEAISPVVGVRAPDVPTLVKRLVDSNGISVNAPEDATFRFLVYQGAALADDYDSEEGLLDALDRSGRDYHEFTAEVNAGDHISDPVELSAEDWAWQPGEKYTITEIPAGGAYSYHSFLNTSAKSYTFTYEPAMSPDIVCENTLNQWTIRIQKENTEAEPLAGAQFALYSPNPNDQMDEEPGISGQIQIDGKTLYLARLGTSGEDGLLEWNDLLESYYYLLEVKAPDGYFIPESNGEFVYRSSCRQNRIELKVVNIAGYELPNTGGIGTRMLTGFGMALILVSALLLLVRSGRQKKISFRAK